MLNQQFFNRAQVTKILGFKSVSMLQSLENKGFIKPDIKPSRYSLNQVLFIMICKELIDFRKCKFSWKSFIEHQLNTKLKCNLIDNKVLLDNKALLLFDFINTNRMEILLRNDDDLVRRANFYFYNETPNILLQLKESINNTSESNTCEINPSLDLPNFYIFCDIDYDIYTFPIDRIYQKLQNKCIELQIDLNEKIRA